VIVREASNPNNIIDSSFIKDIHSIMFEDALQVAPNFVSKPIGAYRLDERYIKGVDIKLSPPHQISNDIENLLYRFKSNSMQWTSRKTINGIPSYTKQYSTAFD
jgi:hypothetical protein